MPSHDIVVVGASAGGVEAVSQLVKRLPRDLAAAVFVVLHFPPYGVSVLPQILNRCGALPARHPTSGELIKPGHIYVAPPDHHLVVQHDRVVLSRGPQENGHRPAIDTLFRSAAYAYGRRVGGVILSGLLDDGTAGLIALKARGGVAIAQDPEEALFDSMPRNAIRSVEVDAILRIADIALRLVELANDAVEEEPFVMDELENEAEVVAREKAAIERGERSGSASTLTCPGCGGVLWELRENNLVRFRCHVGHAYSLESLLAEQANALEQALWSANRALEEKAALARRMAALAREQNRPVSESQFLERAQQAEEHADLVRQVVLHQIQIKTQAPANTQNGERGESQKPPGDNLIIEKE